MNTVFQQYYEKSIRLAPDGFSFFKQEGKSLVRKTFLRSSDALLSIEAPTFFGSEDLVTVIAAHHIPMLVPAEIHNPEKNAAYLQLQFDTSQLGAAFADTTGMYQSVYFLTQNENDTVGRLPFRCQIVAESTLYYRFLLENAPELSVFLAMNSDFVDIMAVQKGEIAFLNRFHLIEPSDILCYLYNIMKQFNLKQPELFLHFFEEEDKKLLQLLKQHSFKTNIL